jgi:hypothetical protein
MRREREKHAGDDSVDFIKRFFGCFPVYNCSSQGNSHPSSFFPTEPTRPCVCMDWPKNVENLRLSPFFEMKWWWWWRGDVAGVCTRRRFKRRDDRVRVVEPTPKILSPGPGRAHLFFPLTSYLLLRMTILFYFIYFSFSDVTWKSNCRDDQELSLLTDWPLLELGP